MAPLIRLGLRHGTSAADQPHRPSSHSVSHHRCGRYPGRIGSELRLRHQQRRPSGRRQCGRPDYTGGFARRLSAFRWTAGDGMQNLGALPGPGDFSEARGINDAGHVVGLSAGTDFRAFLWTPRAGMQNLGTLPGGDFSEAFGINNAGQVVGRATAASGDRAFLWTARGGRRHRPWQRQWPQQCGAGRGWE